MHVESFPIGKKAALRRIAYRPTEEKVDAQFPFLLMTGRTLQQFNAGTMTMRTQNRKLRPTDFLEVSLGDAEHLQLHKGDRVMVKSRYGSASLPIRITRRVKPGELFATFHDAAVFLNRITSPRRDRYVKSPEYKVTAVRIEKISQNKGV
jgi:formate dehydrogenase major subunit